ncbi:AbrB/MazE/SpoVT family DNA-binding domain-containing protein [Dehalobacterium formicoaceticum]|uniref:AbrB/MazE/SpoVT family DNA-binding domain-containing protein n=1 Tax=Dehalobacterium formicoaceticum TaxID=51515 RepID=A0ABT1Y8U8_9FIRM|nr:AbrB/MazE/SpoVT family DNA-binding domain-containing protein [Dehalobacterium formicoaceticum]MCR6546998.1 AbrB/MazE/SpoVT family DNA-binding domain-containing protein [Dehalobacterium formicoaceticum]
MSIPSRLKLKVSPKGQITLPKKIRQDLRISDYVYLEINGEKAYLKPTGFLDDLNSIIAKEVKAEGFEGKEAEAKILEKKKLLVKNLKQELDERKSEEVISFDDAITELELD